MDLYPAVDLLDGRCVRLVQGDFDRRTDYGDPVAAAVELARAGAPWLHVVDLDGARTGRPVNRQLVRDIAAAVSVPVQAGGGVRDESGVIALFDAGVARVVLGTAAVEDPDLVTRLATDHPGRIAVGLDHRRGELSLRGWTEAAGAGLLDALGRLEDAGVAAAVVTDIGRDGTLEGPDLEGLTAALGASSVGLIASGGVASVGDLARLAELEADGQRLAGVIVGRAIHDGRVDLQEALAACAPSG
jgi:phosphoribosylformimino-5-aminoimidazole carboxamide ribotide isomerase